MIVEHRTYIVKHGLMAEYLQRYEKHGLHIQLRHLGPLLGFYVSEVGVLNEVTHLWSYESMADRETRRAKLMADPEWQAFLKTNAGTFEHQQTKILKPTSFSPQ
ncbi:MAG TPA: NIPSNAP family protein [Devosiaceae bacterium]